MSGNLTVDLYDPAGAVTLVDDLTALHVASIAGTPQEHDPFVAPERFKERLAGYMRAPAFAVSTARDGSDLVGYAFGYGLPADARWWEGLLDPVPDGFTLETGVRTLAVNEIHVRADHRGRGIASAVHGRLLESGPWARATLLARPENPALGQYQHWGYLPVGRLRPFADAPEYLALVLQLD
jgi:ribosomal protein S18 acetylase RimI-like enzyme